MIESMKDFEHITKYVEEETNLDIANICDIYIRLPAKNDPAPPLGNFADIVYLKEQSFLHRIRDVCTL